jgi:hypothetical protein
MTMAGPRWGRVSSEWRVKRQIGNRRHPEDGWMDGWMDGPWRGRRRKGQGSTQRKRNERKDLGKTFFLLESILGPCAKFSDQMFLLYVVGTRDGRFPSYSSRAFGSL